MEEMIKYMKEQKEFAEIFINLHWGDIGKNASGNHNTKEAHVTVMNLHDMETKRDLLDNHIKYAEKILAIEQPKPKPFADKLPWCELWLMRMQDLRKCEYVVEFQRDIDIHIETLQEEIKELGK